MSSPVEIRSSVANYYLFRLIHSLTGIFPLFLFIMIQFVYAAILLFGSKDMVQTIISIQSLTVVSVFELTFISLPLLFHLMTSLILIYHGQINVHQYGFGGNWRYVGQKIACIAVFIFVVFHLYQTCVVHFGTLEGHQYIYDILIAHKSMVWMGLYWTALVFCVYYFCQGLWSFLIDWGVTANPTSQRVSFVICLGLFVLFNLYIAFVLASQMLPGGSFWS